MFILDLSADRGFPKPEPGKWGNLSCSWVRRNGPSAGLLQVDSNTKEVRRLSRVDPAVLEFKQHAQSVRASCGNWRCPWLLGNIDETPLKWFRERRKTWVVAVREHLFLFSTKTSRTLLKHFIIKSMLQEGETCPEVRFRRKWRPPTPSKSRCLGHCSAPAYSRTFSTVVTCTTPYVKGKILVIVKAKFFFQY